MEVTKTYVQFLEDLFSFFKAKYSNNEEYKAYKYSHDKYRVCVLTIPNCPVWASPALMLKNWGNSEDEMNLILTLSAPSPGYNEELGGSALTIHASNRRGNNSWITQGDMQLVSADIKMNDLRQEVTDKALELYATGVYGFVPQKEPLMSLR